MPKVRYSTVSGISSARMGLPTSKLVYEASINTLTVNASSTAIGILNPILASPKEAFTCLLSGIKPDSCP